MAEFSIGEVKLVRNLSDEQLVNDHLVDGWELLLVRAGVRMDHRPVTGKLQEFPITVCVVGWLGGGAPKPEPQYKDARLDTTSRPTPWSPKWIDEETIRRQWLYWRCHRTGICD